MRRGDIAVTAIALLILGHMQGPRQTRYEKISIPSLNPIKRRIFVGFLDFLGDEERTLFLKVMPQLFITKL